MATIILNSIPEILATALLTIIGLVYRYYRRMSKEKEINHFVVLKLQSVDELMKKKCFSAALEILNELEKSGKIETSNLIIVDVLNMQGKCLFSINTQNPSETNLVMSIVKAKEAIDCNLNHMDVDRYFESVKILANSYCALSEHTNRLEHLTIIKSIIKIASEDYQIIKNPNYRLTIELIKGQVYGRISEIYDNHENSKMSQSCFNGVIKQNGIEHINDAATLINCACSMMSVIGSDVAQNDLDNSIGLLQKALSIIDMENQQDLAVAALQNMGIAFSRKFEIEENSENYEHQHKTAQKAFEKALFYAGASGDERKVRVIKQQIATLHRSIYYTYNDDKYYQVALNNIDEATNGITINSHPFDYCSVLLEKGNLLNIRGLLKKEQSSFEDAIKLWVLSLSVFSFESYPERFAIVHNNIGKAYFNIFPISKKRDHLHLAEKHFKQVLIVYKQQTHIKKRNTILKYMHDIGNIRKKEFGS